MIDIKATIDADRASAEFKQARREIQGQLKKGLVAAGEKVALPEAKRRAPVKTGRLRASLTVRATTKDAYLTTSLRGKKGRYVGLLEYGGTVRTPIEPKKAQAILTPFGPRARVVKPRVYKAHLFMSGAVQDKQRQIAEAVRDEVLQAFDGFEIT